MLCALKGEPGDVYNIGSGVETTIAELAEKIKDLSGSKSKIQYLPKRDWDNSGKRFASTVKSREILGFEAIVPISEGLKVTINWTKENIKLIERNINKHMDHLNYYN